MAFRIMLLLVLRIGMLFDIPYDTGLRGAIFFISRHL